MIYDRQYMREPSSGAREVSALAWIIGALVVAFALQHLAVSFGGKAFIEQYLALSRRLASGYVWTLFTYGFLHDDLLHILLNCLGIYLLGRALLPIMGTQRFVAFCLGAAVTGGLAWFTVVMTTDLGGYVLGTSAVPFGLIAIFGTLYSEQRIGFVLLPWSFRAKYFAWAMAGISFVGMAALEIPGRDNYAHSAHLGGMLAGWLYSRYIHLRTGEFALRPAIELPAWMRRRKRAKARVLPTYTVNVTPPPQDLRAEVDRILDKINSDGFGALTEEERRVLDDARDLLNKR